MSKAPKEKTYLSDSDDTQLSTGSFDFNCVDFYEQQDYDSDMMRVDDIFGAASDDEEDERSILRHSELFTVDSSSDESSGFVPRKRGRPKGKAKPKAFPQHQSRQEKKVMYEKGFSKLSDTNFSGIQEIAKCVLKSDEESWLTRFNTVFMKEKKLIERNEGNIMPVACQIYPLISVSKQLFLRQLPNMSDMRIKSSYLSIISSQSPDNSLPFVCAFPHLCSTNEISHISLLNVQQSSVYANKQVYDLTNPSSRAMLAEEASMRERLTTLDYFFKLRLLENEEYEKYSLKLTRVNLGGIKIRNL